MPNSILKQLTQGIGAADVLAAKQACAANIMLNGCLFYT
jgi:hypothetical protein